MCIYRYIYICSGIMCILCAYMCIYVYVYIHIYIHITNKTIYSKNSFNFYEHKRRNHLTQPRQPKINPKSDVLAEAWKSNRVAKVEEAKTGEGIWDRENSMTVFLTVRWFGYQRACVCAELLSCVWLFATLWTVAHQAPLSMGFSRQEYCSGCHFPFQGIFLMDLSHLSWQADSLSLSHLESE